MNQQQACVVIVGAGSSGLAAALELTRQGQAVRIVDKAPAPTTESRGTGLQARTLELLGLYGVADDIVRLANPLKALRFFLDGRELGGVEFTANSSRFPFSPALPQAITEGVLRDRLESKGVRVEWGMELRSLTHESDGVTLNLSHSDGAQVQLSTQWLVACDGSRSTVRNLLGLSFEGQSYPEGWALMDATVDWPLSQDEIRVWRRSTGGQFIAVPLGNDIWRLQIDTRDSVRETELPTTEEMQAALRAATGIQATVSSPRWRANFRVGRRQVSDYRAGRVLLAGDAAHVHTPAGGQGLNMGIQDAINLGWKLALVVQGRARDELIDSYQAERKPIAAGVLELTEVLARRPEAMVAGKAKSAREHADAVGQLAYHYRDGPLSPATEQKVAAGVVPGERVADVMLGGERLYELIGLGGLIVVLCGIDEGWGPIAESMRRRWRGAIRVWNLADEDAAGAGRLSAPAKVALQEYLRVDSGAIVIRPDAYFGLVAVGVPAEVRSRVEDYFRVYLHLIDAAAS